MNIFHLGFQEQFQTLRRGLARDPGGRYHLEPLLMDASDKKQGSSLSPMVFRNYGTNFQLRMESAEDLAHIQELEEARWAATSTPVRSFLCDPGFLSYLDPRKTGRIRTDQVRSAQAWLFHMLADRGRLTEGTDVLRIQHIDTSHEEGRKMKRAIEFILEQLSESQRHQLSLAQVREFRAVYAKTVPNGDGVLPPESVDDPETAQLVGDVLQTVGGVEDLSGFQGIRHEELDEFLAKAKKLLAWEARGRSSEQGQGKSILPWDSDTPKAAQQVFDLDPKIEQFHGLCDLIRIDERAASRMQLQEEELRALDIADPKVVQARLAEAPLATPDAEGVLSLSGPLNPHYQARLRALGETVLKRALREPVDRLTRDAWRNVKEIFSAYRAWQDEKPNSLGNLGEEKLRAYLDGPLPERVRQLIDEDRSVAEQLEMINVVEKLILYHRWFMGLANNFVSFPHLYDPDRRALFEMGTFVIDGRELAFTVRVEDRAAHRKIAENSHIFLVYAKLTDKRNDGEGFVIAAAVTAGDQRGIEIGKRGVFFDIAGKQWDAVVIDIAVNPISLWEAVKAPFKKASDLVTRQAEKFGAAQSQTLENVTAEKMEKIDRGEKAGPTPGTSTTSMRDLLLGGGIAFAAVGSSLAFVIKTLSGIKFLNVLYVLLALAGVVTLASTLMGVAKLRKRDLSPLLEASGWAINLRMRLTRSLCRLFTRTPGLPKGSVKIRQDVLNQFAGRLGYKGLSWKKAALSTLRVAGAVIISLLLLLGVYAVLAAFSLVPPIRAVWVLV